ncbi:HD domain-containing protein [Lachnospiraceae bacterium ZAX-1]
MTHQTCTNIVDIIRNACRYSNTSRIAHGERVAYILMKMLQQDFEFTEQEKQDIFMLGLLHDVGAYKKDDADSRNRLSGYAMDDSVFAYLLFKAFSPVPEYAECILYHHHYKAQYYAVPICERHREIAHLIYLADFLDTSIFLNGTSLPDLLKKQKDTIFCEKHAQQFMRCNAQFSILDKLYSMEYKSELDEYTHSTLCVSASKQYAYLMMFLFSLDFRDDYTALHTSHALFLSQKFLERLDAANDDREITRLCVLLHDIGRVALPPASISTLNYELYLKRILDRSILDVTKKILASETSHKILSTIEESFLLLGCLSTNRNVYFTPTLQGEITALSFFISHNLTNFSYMGKLNQHDLFLFIKQRYATCDLDDTILLTLWNHYKAIEREVLHSCNEMADIYQKIKDDNHFLNTMLVHYNMKYR